MGVSFPIMGGFDLHFLVLATYQAMAFDYGTYLSSSHGYFQRFDPSASFGSSCALGDLDLHRFIAENNAFSFIASSQVLVNFSRQTYPLSPVFTGSMEPETFLCSFGPFTLQRTEQGYLFPIYVKARVRLVSKDTTNLTGSLTVRLRQEGQVLPLDIQMSFNPEILGENFHEDWIEFLSPSSSLSSYDNGGSILEGSPSQIVQSPTIFTVEERQNPVDLVNDSRTVAVRMPNCYLDFYGTPDDPSSLVEFIEFYNVYAEEFCPVLTGSIF